MASVVMTLAVGQQRLVTEMLMIENPTPNGNEQIHATYIRDSLQRDALPFIAFLVCRDPKPAT